MHLRNARTTAIWGEIEITAGKKKLEAYIDNWDDNKGRNQNATYKKRAGKNRHIEQINVTNVNIQN